MRSLAPVLLVAGALVLAGCGGSSNNSGGDPQPGPLTVTSVAPGNGSMAGGYRAQVRGTGFSVGVTEVRFGRNAATDVSVSGDTTINLTVPASNRAITVDVTVRTANDSATLEGGFFYNDPPLVLGVVPVAGPGGLTVSILGLNFQRNDAGQPAVLFGANPSIAPQVVNDTLIFATVPVNPAGGVVDVTVTNANGTDTAPNAFLYILGTGKATALRASPAEDTPARAWIADLETRRERAYEFEDGRWRPVDERPLKLGPPSR